MKINKLWIFVLLTLLVSSFAHAEIFRDDFDRPNNIIVGNDWVQSSPAGTGSEIDDERLYLYDNSGSNAMSIYRLINMSNSTFNVSFTSNITSGNFIDAELRDGSIRGVNLRFDNGNFRYVYDIDCVGGGGTSVATVGAYSQGIIYNHTLVVRE